MVYGIDCLGHVKAVVVELMVQLFHQVRQDSLKGRSHNQSVPFQCSVWRWSIQSQTWMQTHVAVEPDINCTSSVAEYLPDAVDVEVGWTTLAKGVLHVSLLL